MEERRLWFWLNNIEGIGNIKIRRLLEIYDNPVNIYNADREELERIPGITKKDAWNITNEEIKNVTNKNYILYEKNGIKFTFPWEEEYPFRLKELYDKPQILYYIGRIPDEKAPAVAMVGSRNCSEYGRMMARELSFELAKCGVNIISGLALGIDSEAHMGALMAGGNTYGVLAGGVDKCYPFSNYNLYMDILKKGGVLSEYPPGTRTVPGMFPLRNRIVSGLSDMVVVVEAGNKSGSLITVNHALEQNRIVYALPGRICDKMSEGCNRLIGEGAGIITSVECLLRELGIQYVKEEKTENKNLLLATEEKMLYSLLLDFVPRSLDTILEETKLSVSVVLNNLLRLELKGLIKEISKNFYVRIS